MATISETFHSLAERVGQECNTLHYKVGLLSELNTSAQDSAVAAINELKSDIDTLSDTVGYSDSSEDFVATFETALES